MAAPASAVGNPPAARYPFSPFPVGWYALGFADEWAPGAVRGMTVFGKEIVVFRTETGELHALDAYCPHLGAHLAHGGTVVGDAIRCPFHGFRFDGTGACVGVEYANSKPPPRARVACAPVIERNGVVLAWWHPAGAPPSFDVPSLEQDGWSALRHVRFDVRSHPQETTENSVDVGHFAAVHRYRDVRVLRALETDGAYLGTSYAMRRKNAFFSGDMDAEFDVHVHGLGYSQVDVRVPSLGLRTRQWVLATPSDGDRIALRIAVSIRVEPDAPWYLRAPPAGMVVPVLLGQAIAAYEHDVRQDFAIWENKRHVHPPILAAGDGPVGPYRAWCRQFYPEG